MTPFNPDGYTLVFFSLPLLVVFAIGIGCGSFFGLAIGLLINTRR